MRVVVRKIGLGKKKKGVRKSQLTSIPRKRESRGKERKMGRTVAISLRFAGMEKGKRQAHHRFKVQGKEEKHRFLLSEHSGSATE